MNDVPDVCVCICTFRRPQLLEQLLPAIARQETRDRFTFSIVVVDNDSQRSAEKVVKTFASSTVVRTDYVVEPVQNIALARNRALRMNVSEYVAFFDDDQLPHTSWLYTLFEMCE